jgi:hypothetical protein
VDVQVNRFPAHEVIISIGPDATAPSSRKFRR